MEGATVSSISLEISALTMRFVINHTGSSKCDEEVNGKEPGSLMDGMKSE